MCSDPANFNFLLLRFPVCFRAPSSGNCKSVEIAEPATSNHLKAFRAELHAPSFSVQPKIQSHTAPSQSRLPRQAPETGPWRFNNGVSPFGAFLGYVIPAQAGIQCRDLDSRLRGNDGEPQFPDGEPQFQALTKQ